MVTTELFMMVQVKHKLLKSELTEENATLDFAFTHPLLELMDVMLLH